MYFYLLMIAPNIQVLQAISVSRLIINLDFYNVLQGKSVVLLHGVAMNGAASVLARRLQYPPEP